MKTYEPVDPPDERVRKVKGKRPWFASSEDYEVQHFRGANATYMRVTNHGTWKGRTQLAQTASHTDGLPPECDQWYKVTSR